MMNAYLYTPITKSNEDTESINEWVNWIEEAIDKKHIKYYEYENFKNIQEICSGAFGKVFRANWKNFQDYLALKSFFNLNNVTVKEIVNEVLILLKSFFDAHFFFKKKYIYLLFCVYYSLVIFNFFSL